MIQRNVTYMLLFSISMQVTKMSRNAHAWVSNWLTKYHYHLLIDVIIRIEELSVCFWLRQKMVNRIDKNGLENSQRKFNNYVLNTLTSSSMVPRSK